MSEAVKMTADAIQPFVQQNENQWRLDLYLKGVKCGHCVHKISKEIEMQSQLNHFQFEAGGKRLSLWADQTPVFGEVIGKITSLGFEAIPVTDLSEELEASRTYKADLKKLAVAAVCAGNIMLFSTAVYLGAPKDFANFFHKLSFFLVLPTLVYSASSIWRGFFQSLRALRFNLDLPIGLALAVGFGLSTVSLLGDQKNIYFDSLAVVIFLVLASRFVLNRYVANIRMGHLVQSIPGVFQARVLTASGPQMRAVQQIQKGDHVLLERGEVVPVDGQLLSKEAIVDVAVLTGESAPVVLHQNEKIFAGTRLCAGEIQVQAEATGADTRVGGYIQRAQAQQKQANEESYKFVSVFTGFVVFASLLTFAITWALLGLAPAYQRAFAIILVACPCAISFGIPLIRSFSGQLALKNGIVLKDPSVLKKVVSIKNIFLDKTGTLTQATIGVEKDDLQSFSSEDQQKIFSLEMAMDHPISNGFKEILPADLDRLPVENFQYHPGRGLSGQIDGEKWAVESDTQASQKQLKVLKNGEFLGVIRLRPAFKEQLSNFFQTLVQAGYRLSVLSGDQFSEVEKIKELVPEQGQGVFLGQATPEEKQDWIEKHQEDSLMVGDGVNDIAAMQSATVSLCMPGALENNMTVADATLTRGDLQSVLSFFALAKKITGTEKRLLAFTFTYNLICVAAASVGWITPVAAAILMPISSIVVLSIVTLSLRRL